MSDQRTDPPVELEERFRAYLDEELSPEEAAALEAQLAADQDLRDDFDAYRGTVELLRRVGPAPAPESLLPNIQRRIAGRHMREHLQPTVRFPFEVLAFVILLVGIFYLYFAMAPGNPGTISKKVRPGVVEVDCPRPLPDSLVQEFGLQPVETDRPFEKTLYVSLDRNAAARLLDALKPLAKEPPALPADGDRISVVIVTPLK